MPTMIVKQGLLASTAKTGNQMEKIELVKTVKAAG
jgi:hypothetical protein